MSRLLRFTLAFICAMAVVFTAMGSSNVVAHANEDAAETVVAEPEQPVYDAMRGDSEDNLDGDFTEASLGYDVCFFIKNEVDSKIPNEPEDHPSSEYSSAIRIDHATYCDQFIYYPDYEEKPEAFKSDGFTYNSGVLDYLIAYPNEEQIKNVAPGFDPQSQFIVWYVIKKSVTAYPNTDVTIHVDGVIKTRQYHEAASEEEPGPNPEIISDPGDIVVPTPAPGSEQPPEIDISKLSFNVYSKNLDVMTVGDEEYIGGYVVEVLDQDGKILAQYSYGAYGQELGETSYVETLSTTTGGGDFDLTFLQGTFFDQAYGTVFSFMGQTFGINVDSAFIKKTAEEIQVIPLLFRGQEVSPSEVKVYDKGGNVLTGTVNIPRVENKRKITVTAGSTVQNDNGQTLTNSNVVVSAGSLVDGHNIVAILNGSITGPGECANEITSIHIYDKDGRDATAYYDIDLQKGKLVLVAQGSNNSDSNSTGSAVTRVIAKDDNETVVTNSQQVLQSGRDNTGNVRSGIAKTNKQTNKELSEEASEVEAENSDLPTVLGARRSDTGDLTVNAGARLALIVLCLMLVSIIGIKKNKTK